MRGARATCVQRSTHRNPHQPAAAQWRPTAIHFAGTSRAGCHDVTALSSYHEQRGARAAILLKSTGARRAYWHHVPGPHHLAPTANQVVCPHTMTGSTTHLPKMRDRVHSPKLRSRKHLESWPPRIVISTCLCFVRRWPHLQAPPPR